MHFHITVLGTDEHSAGNGIRIRLPAAVFEKDARFRSGVQFVPANAECDCNRRTGETPAPPGGGERECNTRSGARHLREYSTYRGSR